LKQEWVLQKKYRYWPDREQTAEPPMDFLGPSAADFASVTSLNHGFLALLRRDPRRGLAELRPDLAQRLRSLTPPEAVRLAAAPFLLMSFRERDDRFWEAALERHGRPDLFAPQGPDELAALAAAGLGFLWQLARHNPYAARLVCGGSVHWCEQLTEIPYLELSALAALGDTLLTLRAGSDSELWSKLLSSGLSPDEEVRRAAHITALQTVLTRPVPPARAWPAAACAARVPSLKVADDG
jgi:hypothetical protein